ncbi:MAG: polysaccharide deacetylase [Clostridia bacterium]|jgi:peptidoglycan/xylan/chitin deacetylase (PgdA/CDA1 family)|nr:polysaccharide deacetylase [Clostridia bacterium]
MIKREIIILSILITALFLLCGTVFVSAEDYDKYGIYVNNTKLDQSVKVFEGFSYVPINNLKNSLNITIVEDQVNHSITITSGTKVIKITNNNLVEIDGSIQKHLDVPLVVKDNNIYFPILSLIDILGYQVETMDDIKCIRIKMRNETILAGSLIDSELNKTVAENKSDNAHLPKVAYLTFDDGLDSTVTPIILDILKQHEVKGTFFILGKTIEKNTDLLKRMVAEGHSIGNHTYTHKKEYIYSSATGLQAEIEKTNAALFKAAGITTSLFRPPYGGPYIRKDMFQEVLKPYKTILWNIDSRDSSARDVSREVILNNVKNQAKNKRSAVIIMHDSGTHIETAHALPEIIKYLKDEGFTIEPITESTNIYYEY